MREGRELVLETGRVDGDLEGENQYNLKLPSRRYLRGMLRITMFRYTGMLTDLWSIQASGNVCRWSENVWDIQGAR